MAKPITIPIRAFKTAGSFETWMVKHHTDSDGLWIKIFKKDSAKKTISYAEALDIALCYGWIDGQKQAFDEESLAAKVLSQKRKKYMVER